MPLPSLPRPPPTPLLSICRLFSRRKHPDSKGLVSGTPRICESSGVCDTGGGCGEEQFIVSGKGVRRALEAEPQNRLPVHPVVPPPSPGRDLRAPSGLPTSADSAWLTPPRPGPDPGGRPFPGYPASTLGYSVGSLPAARDSPGN